MISVPLAPPTPMTAKSLAALTGATTVITLDTAHQQFVGWTPTAPDDGFPVEGGKGYIVNVPETPPICLRRITVDKSNGTLLQPHLPYPSRQIQETWAFVVSGHLEGKPAFGGYQDHCP